MNSAIEKQVYRLQGIAGTLHTLAESCEIAEIGEELPEMVSTRRRGQKRVQGA